MGSMNMPGISLSLLNLTNVAQECSGISTAQLIDLIDAPHNSAAWPATQNFYPLAKGMEGKSRHDRFTEVEQEEKKVETGGPKLSVDPEALRKAMSVASEDVIALEPQLTKWDTVRASDPSAGMSDRLS